MNTPILNVSMVQANVEEENGPKSLPPVPTDVIQEAEPILDAHASTSRKMMWKQEDTEAPKGGFVAFNFSFLFSLSF